MAEAMTRTEEVVSLAAAQGEFTMNELAHFARCEDLYDADEHEFFITKGIQADVKDIIKAQLTIGQKKHNADGTVSRDPKGKTLWDVPRLPVFVCISASDYIWKRLVDCTRVECRAALAIKARKLHESNVMLQSLKRYHEDRFKETVDLPGLSKRGWDPNADKIPVHRNK